MSFRSLNWKDGPGGEKIPLQFRYTVNPALKVNAFLPKQLPENTDFKSVRASQLGACAPLDKIPMGDVFCLVWEAPSPNNLKLCCKVKVGKEVPALITPAKPKVYLKCRVALKPKTAHCLSPSS